jgi:RNA polymerase-binding transcription factor
MTPQELSNFRSVLETRQTELEGLLRDREVIAVNASADMLDQIQHAQERDMAMGNLERGSARLSEVRHALHRIELGNFGICVDCEEEISMKRLAAVPWTTSCLTCQEATDRSRMPTRNEEPVLNAA